MTAHYFRNRAELDVSSLEELNEPTTTPIFYKSDED